MDQNETSLLGRLSGRQRQCLALVAKGCSSKQIARQLGLSPSTVDNHINAAVQLLNVDDRRKAAQLVAVVLDSDHISAPPIVAHDARTSLLKFPPLGGIANRLSARMRFWHIFQIALVSVLGMSAIVVVISGFVALFAN
jgi:DNA-binding CsgD family transcriptional regulator